MKTILILTGGVLIFGESMPPKKLAGICLAFCGIVWYSKLKLSEARIGSAKSGQVTIDIVASSKGGLHTVPSSDKIPAIKQPLLV